MKVKSSQSKLTDEEQNQSKSSYFEMPALDISVAFPQATPASIFPPCTSDYYQFDDILTSQEQAIRLKVRDCMEKNVAPIMAERADTGIFKATFGAGISPKMLGLVNLPVIRGCRFNGQYWEKAKFPFHLVPKFGSLGIAGGTIKGYGCPGLSTTANAIATAEVARVDASCSTFILVHSSLAMSTIAICGSEAQKQKYLPSMAQLETIGCWGLTEPDYGSDASALKTTATKVDRGWLLNGQKRWIGNSTFADVLVIFARNITSNELHAFLVKKDTPGLQARKMENKIGLRIVQNGDILMKQVFVPEEDRLPGVNSFQDINNVLGPSRLNVAWQPIGISMGVYDMCHRYLKERKQFGAPLAAFQISQQKLVQMLGNIQAMFLIGWRLCKLYDKGEMTVGKVSLGKAWISSQARETVSLGRELLGGNGILTDFLVAKAFCDLEPIFTYEGTYDINTLVAGREVTGISSFKPAFTSRSRL